MYRSTFSKRCSGQLSNRTPRMHGERWQQTAPGRAQAELNAEQLLCRAVEARSLSPLLAGDLTHAVCPRVWRRPLRSCCELFWPAPVPADKFLGPDLAYLEKPASIRFRTVCSVTESRENDRGKSSHGWTGWLQQRRHAVAIKLAVWRNPSCPVSGSDWWEDAGCLYAQ